MTSMAMSFAKAPSMKVFSFDSELVQKAKQWTINVQKVLNYKEPELFLERFIIDSQLITKTIADVKESKIDYNGLLKSINLATAECRWLEWSVKDDYKSFVINEEYKLNRVGIFVTRLENNSLRYVAFCELLNKGYVLLTACDLNPHDQTLYQIATGLLTHKDSSNSNFDHPIIHQVIAETSCVLFALSVPQYCNISTHVPAIKLNRARIKRGKLPLVEYKTVTMHLFSEKTHRLPGETEENFNERKRRHQVRGHFRHYTKGRSEELISWVPAHWRGDASKGIILKEILVKE